MVQALKTIIGTEKFVIGSDRVLKGVRKGLVKEVFVASNAPELIRARLTYYQKIDAELTVSLLSQNSKELALLCKKPFNIVMAGLFK
ncbi:MAG: ribosomal L7Ae/L30e/S12e/Gadd45 family protein [Candidatus Woesearchaeota archaeon]|nr:MAG: ribosomal L7Ae/L30e/S12e/Gadd45 family protein [Candidatus Woesearchaeota archaeon]